ncbi:unnamed protein product [Ectocarpus sp. 6 AP-2014]
MSSAQEGTTLILATVAVCLLIYVMRQEYRGPHRYPRVAGVVGAIKGALGSRGATDCSKINPAHADWARCAQGSAMGRVPTKNPAAVVTNTSLDFASDSLKNQGLGTGRLQDDFVHDQYSSNLGVSRPGGMRIDKSSLKNNAFFSSGTQNASKLVVETGISSEGAAAFPFSRKSGDKREEYAKTSTSGNVPGTEPVGMGMKLAHLKQKAVSSVATGGGGRSASRAQVNKKLGVAPFEKQGVEFNPFSGNKESLGAGLKISEAFDAKNLGMGSGLEEAYGSLGAAVSPFSSSDVGVSPDEIAAATSTLKEVNIVQSTGGENIDRFIRP